MKFTAKEIKNTSYRYIDLQEHFKEIRDYPEDEEAGLGFYNFEMLFEDEKEILFAIKNTYRSDIYILDLATFECKSQGSIESYNPTEGDSLYLRGISMEKIYFDYRANDQEYVNGVYCCLEKRIIDRFQGASDYDYLYLTDRYYIKSKDAFYWDEEKDQWNLDAELDRVYLYDRIEERDFEIFDEKIKNSYHTSSNHFVRRYKDEEYLLNFPFRRDPEDVEDMIRESYIEEVMNDPKEISYIKLDEFAETIKLGEDIPFKTLTSWKEISILKPYFYFNYTSKSLDFSIYNLKNRTIEVLRPVFSDLGIRLESLVTKSYAHLKSAMNVTYIGKETILAHKDYETEILSPINKTIKHSRKETLIDFNENYYLINGWDEDEDGENFKEYTIVLDGSEKEIARLDGYFLKLEHEDILIKI
nr:hypothetical protein [Tissierella sp.]